MSNDPCESTRLWRVDLLHLGTATLNKYSTSFNDDYMESDSTCHVLK